MNSLTEENYLKAVYRLSQMGEEKISLTAIAAELGVNAASVVDMIKKLSEKKLIHYQKKSGAELTDQGMAVALSIVRNHRLWEVFLVEKLGYSWDVVHDIAEQLEHVKHGELADRLDDYLGHPKYDPHGDPIPNSDGIVPSTPNTLLSEIEAGKSGKVAAIRDTSPLFLQYLERLSIQIGTRIEVIEKIPYDDSIVIQPEDAEKTTVSKKLADSLLVHA